MSYQKVFPRDYFNIANLLKSLGKISVAILDDKLPNVTQQEQLFEDFEIEQNDYGIYANVEFLLGDCYYLPFIYPYNSKAPYDLKMYDFDDGWNELIDVLNEDGTIRQSFKDYIEESHTKLQQQIQDY